MTALPAIFGTLKSNIERHLNIVFDYENKNDTMNYQKNGFDCGVFCFNKAEQICLEGESSYLNVFYAIAERARGREIIHRLAFDGCPNDEWFPKVKNANDYLDSTEHLKVRDKNGKRVEILDKVGGELKVQIENDNVGNCEATLEDKNEEVQQNNMIDEFNEEIKTAEKKKETYQEFIKRKKVAKNDKF